MRVHVRVFVDIFDEIFWPCTQSNKDTVIFWPTVYLLDKDMVTFGPTIYMVDKDTVGFQK